MRSTCLYVATKLGDLMEDVAVVGGFVPSLLIDQRDLPEGVSTHVGTMDLDVGLKLALLDHGRYHTLTVRLRSAKFRPDQTDEGRPTRQRWRAGAGSVTVDFLIPPSLPGDQGGRLRDIESDFAAITTMASVPVGLRSFCKAGPMTRSRRMWSGSCRRCSTDVVNANLWS